MATLSQAGGTPPEGAEIVHSHRKRRGRVNPLVLGSSPSGPTNPSSADVLGCRPASTYITSISYKTRSYVRSAVNNRIAPQPKPD